MAAVLGRQRLGGKKEVVLLPAAGSFFAYEPILKALQSTHPLPLAKYILYEQDPVSSRSSVRRTPVLLCGELVGDSGASGSVATVQVSMNTALQPDLLVNIYRQIRGTARSLAVHQLTSIANPRQQVPVSRSVIAASTDLQ
jgi:hypothetical protein